MTPEQQYTEASYLATEMARIIKGDEQKIIDFAWCPFQLLYVEMVGRKEITPLRDIPEKQKYWDKVKHLKCPMYRKVWVCQALYLHHLMTGQ